MNRPGFRERLKPWILPISMVSGLLFHEALDSVQFIAPYLIFAMLLITFCRVRPSEIRVTGLTLWVVGLQLCVGIGLYFLLRPFGEVLAQGAMICAFCPTATAAPVITSILGGSITTLVAISLLSNLSVAAIAPPFFAMIGSADAARLSFGAEFAAISGRLIPMIVGALALALVMRRLTPRAHHALSQRQDISFYLWAVLLIVVVGRTVSFAMTEPAARIPEMVVLMLTAGAICVVQFIVGRRLGRRYGDPVAGAQGLMQKNTGLAIWMAMSYLDPLCSIAPAAYIAWQNTINSVQIYLHQRREYHAA